MKRIRLFYLKSESKNSLDGILDKFVDQPLPQRLWQDLLDALPVEKWDSITVKQRVEGLVYIAEELWSLALKLGKKSYGQDFSRRELLHDLRSMPMSHYRYVTGSREPKIALLTRDDALQDPSTSLVKLQRDIETLAEFVRQLPESASRPSEIAK